MDPKFQSSFIPKRPVVDSPKILGPVTKSTNIFSVVATFLFIITLLASGGIFAYIKILDRQIATAGTELEEAREAFEVNKIKDLISASSRLGSINNLLENHFAVSRLLLLMQDMTARNTKFNSFSFKASSGAATVSMDGEAVSYNTIAEQSEFIKTTNMFSDINFSDFSLGDSGRVSFKFSGKVAPGLISYKNLYETSAQTETIEEPIETIPTSPIVPGGQ